VTSIDAAVCAIRVYAIRVYVNLSLQATCCHDDSSSLTQIGQWN